MIAIIKLLVTSISQTEWLPFLKNYMEEVSKELGFGFDFRDILKIRKDHRNFFGIVNGYEKKLISPNANKIAHLNEYFKGFDFKMFDENNLEAKLHNKKNLSNFYLSFLLIRNIKMSSFL